MNVVFTAKYFKPLIYLDINMVYFCNYENTTQSSLVKTRVCGLNH